MDISQKNGQLAATDRGDEVSDMLDTNAVVTGEWKLLGTTPGHRIWDLMTDSDILATVVSYDGTRFFPFVFAPGDQVVILSSTASLEEAQLSCVDYIATF